MQGTDRTDQRALSASLEAVGSSAGSPVSSPTRLAMLQNATARRSVTVTIRNFCGRRHENAVEGGVFNDHYLDQEGSPTLDHKLL
jgi:hypothetical protein